MIKKLWLCYKILKWHKKQMKELTCLEQQDKVSKEIYEFLKEKENYTKANGYRKPQYAKRMDIELVDVLISSLNLLNYEQFYELAKEKHKINLNRNWKKGQHIEK